MAMIRVPPRLVVRQRDVDVVRRHVDALPH
jgi:hypothetical protein